MSVVCVVRLKDSFGKFGGGVLFPTAASRNWLPLKRANKIYRLFRRPLGDSAGDGPTAHGIELACHND